MVRVSVVLTNWLSSHSSTKQKLWELQRAAYGSILAELAAVETVLDSATEFIEENEERYFDDEASTRHDATIRSHMKSVRKSYTENYLILSDRFITLFEDFLRSLDERSPDFLPPEEHEKFAETVRVARPKLLQQARSEMPVPRKLWDWARH
jgi:hypothetical protein